MEKATPFLSLLGKVAVPPAAMAFGFWLAAEFPAIHGALCRPLY